MDTVRYKRDPIKVYDARWETNDFTTQEVQRFIEAVLIYARQMEVDTITLSRDARSGSSCVMEITLRQALKSGFTVFLCANPISTTQSYFLTAWVSKSCSHTMGLTVTASHNPASYTGLKITVPTVQAIGLNCGPSGGFAKIREILYSSERLSSKSGGKLSVIDLTDEYIKYCLMYSGIAQNELSGMRVVLDAMNGSAGPEIFTALQRCGVEVKVLRLIPDGTFPTGAPNPTSKGKMNKAIALAKTWDGSLVIGTDGDGDRLVFGDRRGILNAGFASLPVLHSLIRNRRIGKKHPVLYDPKVNPLALQEWSKLDIEPVLFRNGHSQIKQFMSQIEAAAAIEESGHYYHQMTLDNLTFYCENSILTILLFLKALKEKPAIIENLWGLQDQVYCSGELNYKLADDEVRDRAMMELVEWFKSDKAQLITQTADGIDLQGTVVRKGIVFDRAQINLSSNWYNGYLRIATNEKAVLRYYLSAGSTDLGRRLRIIAEQILHGLEAREVE